MLFPSYIWYAWWDTFFFSKIYKIKLARNIKSLKSAERVSVMFTWLSKNYVRESKLRGLKETNICFYHQENLIWHGKWSLSRAKLCFTLINIFTTHSELVYLNQQSWKTELWKKNLQTLPEIIVSRFALCERRERCIKTWLHLSN